MSKEIIYHTALYLRVSRDDEDVDGKEKIESNSIASQRDLVRSFVRGQEDMELFDIYIDDGFSGSNFERPGFKRMIKDIKEGHVNCVAVKDLSRFGRDYIEAGRFIQKIFPAFSVRFIALTDHYDSLTADSNTTSLVIPVKNFVNDSYCRDISIKVRSHQKVKREQGKFIGAFAVYGYCKSDEDKNKLIADEYAAGIVKNIFAWKLDGMSNLAISNRLNELGILSPLEYKKAHGQNIAAGFNAGAIAKWSAVAVKRILTNEVYLGHMVQGKTEKVSYKVNKYLEKPKEEWIKVENTHAAIIGLDDFQNVQRLLQVDTRAGGGKKTSHLFSGLLFCGDCKEPMARRVNKYRGDEKIYYICSTRNKSQGCTRHSILEMDLQNITFHLLRAQIAVFLDAGQQLQHMQKTEINFDEVKKYDRELEKLRGKQERYLTLRAGLYEDYKDDIITEEDYKNLCDIYKKQYTESQKALEKQEEMRRQLFYKGIDSGIRLEKMKDTLELTELNRDTLLTFVNRIEIFEDKKVYVEFRHQQEFHKMLVLSEFQSRAEEAYEEGGCE